VAERLGRRSCDSAICVAGKSGMFERERGPVSDLPVKIRKKKCRSWNSCGTGWAHQHGAEAAGLVGHKAEQHQDMVSRNGAEEALQEAKSIHSAPDDGHVQTTRKPRNRSRAPAGIAVVAGHSTFTMAQMIGPDPRLMPNHPQATMARSRAGTLAPRTPKGRRDEDGEGNSVLGACIAR